MHGAINIRWLLQAWQKRLLLLQAILALVTLVLCVTYAVAQSSGRLQGTVRVASGALVAGVSVIATNEVTGKWKRVRSGAEGHYSLCLAPGAYRLRVGPPHVAKFD